MPLGASRLNFISKKLAAAVVEQRTALTISTDGTYAQIDTAQYKFGGSSFFATSNGWIRADTPANELNFGTGEFTIELWYRITNTTGDYKLCGSKGQTGGLDFRLINGVYHLGRINAAWDQTATSGATINTWHHVAVVRSGTTVTIYHNGSSVGSATNTNTYHFGTSNIGPYFGDEDVYNYTSEFHIDEIRFSDTPRYTSGFTPSTTPFVNDSNTLLLIHADGTDGDTVFIDDNGDRAPKGINSVSSQAVIDTSQYKFGTASVRFNGNTNTDQRLYVYDAANGITTGDYTLECWARFDDFSALHAVTYIGGAPAFYVGSDGKIAYYYTTGTSGTTIMSTNTWYHLAWSRSGTTLRMFVNGNLEATRTDSVSLGNDLLLGCKGANDQDMRGYIDEYRFSNTARYTASFTAPTTAFTNDSDTTFLGHFDQADSDTTVIFDDNGGTLPSYAPAQRTALTITTNGDAQIDTAQYQFGGSSALFDGTGDYLRVDQTIDGEFTMECWIRLANVSGEKYVFRMHNSSDTFSYVMGVINDKIYVYSGGTTAGTISLSTNTWHHLAWSRDAANGLRMYVDGVYDTARTVTTDLTDAKIYIGGFSNSLGVNGHMDEMRISNTARYTTTGSFSVPTAPFVNDANTLLLCHADGTDADTVFIDDNGDRAPNGVQAINQAQISTAQYKFGSSSFVFDGATDYLLVSDTDNVFEFGDSATGSTPEFTIECWFRRDNSNRQEFLWDFRPNSAGAYYTCWFDNGQRMQIYNGLGLINTTATFSANTWYHMALTRDSSGNHKLWINGTQAGSTYTSTSASQGTLDFLTIGANGVPRGGNGYDGYIDEFRVSDTARYTGSFTPSTTAFENDANTLLLLHAEEGANGTTEIFDDNGGTLP